MYQSKLDKDMRCPIKYWQEIFEGKWKSCIVCVLAEKKTLRYGMIRDEIGDITDTVLSTDLKELLDAGIIERKQYEEMPIRVEYSLTEKGWSVVPVLHTVCKWAGEYYHDMKKDEEEGMKVKECHHLVNWNKMIE